MSTWEEQAQQEISFTRSNFGGWISPAIEDQIRERYRASAAAAAAAQLAASAAAAAAVPAATVVDLPTAADEPDPAPNDPPIVAVSAPASVMAGDSVTIGITVSDPNSDLNSMGIRWQGQGLIGHWDLSGGSASRQTTITAPSSGTIYVRGEVWDNAGNGTTGPWEAVGITPIPVPVIQPTPAIAPTPAIVVAPIVTPAIVNAPVQPANDPPAVALYLPQTVNAGETFTARIAVSDPNGDLNSMGIRWQGQGLIGHWDLSGGSDQRDVTVTAPGAGQLQFRGEVWDSAGNGTTGPWTMVDVIPLPVPIPTPTAPVVSEVTIPVTDPRIIPYLDNSAGQSHAAPMPAGVAPSVSVSVPSSVFAGETFRVNLMATDPDADLDSAGIRWQGHGQIGWWDLKDDAYTAAGRYVDVTAPATGPLLFRAEVNDRAGHGFTSDWSSVAVISQPAPSTEDVDSWIRIDRVPTSAPGVYYANAIALQGAPTAIAVAVANANAINFNFGNVWSVDQLMNAIRSSYLRNTAEAIEAGINVTPVPEGPGAEIANFTPDPISLPPTTSPAVILTPNTVTPTPVFVSASPTMALTLPNAVLPREKFTVTLTATDPNADLNSMGIRWEGHGLVDRWDISGASQTRSVDITAPDATGPLRFRGEVFDNAQNGITGDWQTVNVATNPQFDPTHRLAGWDSDGDEVYHLVDESGTTMEWAVRAGDDSRNVIPGSLRPITGTGAQPSQVASHTPPANHPSQTLPIPGPLPSSGNGALLLVLGAAGLAWALSRKRNS